MHILYMLMLVYIDLDLVYAGSIYNDLKLPTLFCVCRLEVYAWSI